MQFFGDTHIDFTGKRKAALMISGLLLVLSLGAVFFRGFNFNIDFTGGTEMQFRFDKPVTEGQLRQALADGGLAAEVTTLRSSDVDHPDWMIKLQASDLENELELVRTQLEGSFPDNPAELRVMHKIGPRIGEELKWDATWSILWAMVFIVIYITVRFEFMYAVGAIIALIHDVLLTLGFFALFRVEISLPIVAALLTIVGYSLNDTIVIYDRIRENVKKLKGTRFTTTVNTSINQTLSRTVLTSGTTLLVVTILFVFGGDTLHNMVLALLLGVVVGTYSSVFIASPVLIEWHDRAAARAAAAK
jgi:preprotein translocase subunit SecF